MKNIVVVWVTSVGVALVASPGAAFIKIDPVGSLQNLANGAGTVLKGAGGVVSDVVKIPVEIVVKPIATEAQKGGENLANEIGKVQGNLNNEAAKANEKILGGVAHIGGEVGKFKNGIDGGIEGTKRAAERQIEGVKLVGEQFAIRVQEGKYLDAVWHIAVDWAKVTEENVAQTAQESEVFRTGLSLAASAYGPYGSAAFTTWYTYKVTGDPKLALRMGLVAGLTSEATKAVAKMPMKDEWQITQKVAAAGALGGLAAAAAGGRDGDIRNGILTATGMMLVQAGYETLAGSNIDVRASEGDPLCKAVLVSQAPCGVEPNQAFQVDGKPEMLGGKVNVDMRKVNQRLPAVGLASAKLTAETIFHENHPFMVSLSKLPGVNAAAVGHDQLVGVLRLGTAANMATIAPAFAVTYYGTEAPLQEMLMKKGMERRSKQPSG